MFLLCWTEIINTDKSSYYHDIWSLYSISRASWLCVDSSVTKAIQSGLSWTPGILHMCSGVPPTVVVVVVVVLFLLMHALIQAHVSVCQCVIVCLQVKLTPEHHLRDINVSKYCSMCSQCWLFFFPFTNSSQKTSGEIPVENNNSCMIYPLVKIQKRSIGAKQQKKKEKKKDYKRK